MDATVLIVETNPEVLQVLDDLFFDLGCFTDVVEGGAQALEYLKQTTPALAVMGAVLPNPSGLDVCFRTKRIKRLQAMQVLILCPQDDEHSLEVAQTVQADAVLTTPLDVELLRQTVLALLERVEQNKEHVVFEFPQ